MEKILIKLALGTLVVGIQAQEAVMSAEKTNPIDSTPICASGTCGINNISSENYRASWGKKENIMMEATTARLLDAASVAILKNDIIDFGRNLAIKIIEDKELDPVTKLKECHSLREQHLLKCYWDLYKEKLRQNYTKEQVELIEKNMAEIEKALDEAITEEIKPFIATLELQPELITLIAAQIKKEPLTEEKK